MEINFTLRPQYMQCDFSGWKPLSSGSGFFFEKNRIFFRNIMKMHFLNLYCGIINKLTPRKMEGYRRIHIPREYISRGNNAPHIREAYTYYESNEVSRHYYRDVLVKCKRLVNPDGSKYGYGWRIVSVDLPSFPKSKMNTLQVREGIDSYFNQLDATMKMPMEQCEYKPGKACDPDERYYERCFSIFGSNRKHTKLQKRWILKDMLEKGLMTRREALTFIKNVWR